MCKKGTIRSFKPSFESLIVEFILALDEWSMVCFCILHFALSIQRHLKEKNLIIFSQQCGAGLVLLPFKKPTFINELHIVELSLIRKNQATTTGRGQG